MCSSFPDSTRKCSFHIPGDDSGLFILEMTNSWKYLTTLSGSICDQFSDSLLSAYLIYKEEERDSASIHKGKSCYLWKNSLVSLAHTHNSHSITSYKKHATPINLRKPIIFPLPWAPYPLHLPTWSVRTDSLYTGSEVNVEQS